MAAFVEHVHQAERDADDRAAALIARMQEPEGPIMDLTAAAQPVDDDVDWWSDAEGGVIAMGDGDFDSYQADQEPNHEEKQAVQPTGGAVVDDSDDDGGDGPDCVICMDSVVKAGVIECCEHVFCYACILQWAERTNLCPCCRKR